MAISSSAIQKERELIDSIINIIKGFLHPRKIILFGSRAVGKGKRYADFDIAVEGVEMGIRKERLLKDALDERLGVFTVDLINIDKVDLEFKKLVLDKGKVIYEQ